MPYGNLKTKYPILKEHKWLTPFYQVRRWGEAVFERKIKKGVRELKVNANITKEDSEKTKKLLTQLGLM
jgi:hypothetical protein